MTAATFALGAIPQARAMHGLTGASQLAAAATFTVTNTNTSGPALLTSEDA